MSRRNSPLFLTFQASSSLLLLCLLAVVFTSFAAEECPVDMQTTSTATPYTSSEIPSTTPEISGTSPASRNSQGRFTLKDLDEMFKGAPAVVNSRKQLTNVEIVKYGSADLSINRHKDFDRWVHILESHQQLYEEVGNQLYEKYNMSHDEMKQTYDTYLQGSEQSQKSKEECLKAVTPVQCDANAKYRTANGQCNNLRHPTYGSSMSCQQRLMPAYYKGVKEFHGSVRGGYRPPARNLSIHLLYHVNRPTRDITHMHMFWGQFLDHDMALTAVSTTATNKPIQCCPPKKNSDPQCKPIILPDDDPFYSKHNMTCMNFVRSAPCYTCDLGPRIQVDQVTAFIDGSQMYGSTKNETDSLRSHDGSGCMKSQEAADGESPPWSTNPGNDHCSSPKDKKFCYQIGDPRGNQHTTLTCLHTLFLREHNRIAKELHRLNPHWNDEIIFQETRRIIIAIMQHITYNEHLPVTIGSEQMTNFNLWVGKETRYDPYVIPSLILEFSSAAFRYGHSLINSKVANYPRNHTKIRLMRNAFFQPFEIKDGICGPLLSGVSCSAAQWFDRHMVPDVSNYLYRVQGKPTGLDLASINIQRGRDHGIPPYVEVVKYCSDGKIIVKTFGDLTKYGLMYEEQKNALMKNYRDVKDVDLWPAMMMEISPKGAIVGPTCACVIAIQFNYSKFGDRFFYEHYNVIGRFNYQQIFEIRKVFLSYVVCLNTKVPYMSKYAMLFPNERNPRIYCKSVRGIDLSYWKDYKKRMDSS